MSNKRLPVDYLTLLEFANTATQKQVIEALIKVKTLRKAAKHLNIPEGTVYSSLGLMRKRAAKQGYSPEHDMVHVAPEPFIVKGVSTYYNAEGQPSGQWVKTTLDQSRLDEIIKQSIDTLSQEIKGLSPFVAPPAYSNDDLLCVIPMGDPHFGMYAWAQDAGDDFDLDIAEKLTCGAIDRLIASAPPAKTALLLNLGDMFHADNQKNVTNSGHQLDVDGRWAKVLQVGLKAMIYCLQRLLEKHHEVIFRINKGNHDGHSSYALALMLSCYFHNEPRIKVDLSPSSVWYYQFGKVQIGSTHGDTIKSQNLPGVMAADQPKAWGETKHRVWYVGHVHHSDLKEYPGCIVEYFRTMAARDAWHQGQGYRAGRDMCCIVHHKEHGEIERHRCDIGMV
jgi:hypothetical protein